MNNIVVLPMALPMLVGVILIFLNKHVLLQRRIALILTIINIGVSILLLKQIHIEGIQTIHFGGWLPPWGISFVADGFAVLLVLFAIIVTAVCLMFAASTIAVKRPNDYIF